MKGGNERDPIGRDGERNDEEEGEKGKEDEDGNDSMHREKLMGCETLGILMEK